MNHSTEGKTMEQTLVNLPVTELLLASTAKGPSQVQPWSQFSTQLNQIAREIADDNAILFLSTNLITDDAYTPLASLIADSLATKLNHPAGYGDLATVAFEYETLYDRAALQNAVVDTLGQGNIQPTALHKLIADLLPRNGKVITTHFDHLLEVELDRLGKPYTSLVQDADVANYNNSRITLIKLHGDISQPATLRLTSEDLDQFLLVSSLLHEQASAWFTTKGLICLGNDLTLPSFRRFFFRSTEKLGRLKQQTRVFTQQPLSMIERRYWEKQAIQLFPCNLNELLFGLTERVKGILPEESTVSLLPPAEEPVLAITAPYKGIESFEQQDAVIFAGRSRESWILANRILAHPRQIVVVNGESGSGKSSLVKAGVAPLLTNAGVVFALCTLSPQQSLLQSLQESLSQTLGRSQWAEVPTPTSLFETIRLIHQTLKKPIVLAIDQFEQIFNVADFEARLTQLQILDTFLQDQEMDVRLLLIVRDDYMGRLQALEKTLPRLLDVRFYLERLTREAAQSAIVEPAVAFGARWEPALVQTLLDELFEDEQGVIAPQLQIICDKLYRESQKPELIHHSPYTITSELYQKLEGVSALLESYLEEAIANVLASFTNFEEKHTPTELRSAIELLLNALISTSNIKQRLTFAELARVITLPPETGEKILSALARDRVLQRYELVNDVGISIEYELIHDALIPLVKRFLGDKFWQMQKVREVLRQSIADWRKPTMHLLALDDLRLIEPQLQSMRFASDEQDLIFASAIALLEPTEQWQELLSPARQLAVLNRLSGQNRQSGHGESKVRGKAASALSEFSNEATALASIAHLATHDPDLAVREEAATSLAHFAQSDLPSVIATVSELEKAAHNDDTNAQWVLAVACDSAPQIQAFLSKAVWRTVVRQVFAMRWSRHLASIKTDVLNALFGGLYGVGMGLGIVVAVNEQATRPHTPEKFLQTIVFGILSLGAMGGGAAAASAFTHALVNKVVQPRRPWLAPFVGTLVGSLLLATIFGFQNWGYAGLLLSIVWIGAAFATRSLSPVLRMTIVMVAGVTIALFCQHWGLLSTNTHPALWAIMIGSIGGLGFAAGLSR